MLAFFCTGGIRKFMQYHNTPFVIPIAFKSTCQTSHCVENEREIERISKLINDHPFPDVPLQPTLVNQIPSSNLCAEFVDDVLGRLFASHANGLKAYEFFRYTLQCPHVVPTPDAFEKTLHILVRMRYFDKAWKLMEEIGGMNPSSLTLKSMSIYLSKVAKFGSYEETLEAFERMEKEIFVGRKFGTDEFNVLLRAFCTQRQMKEAKSMLNKMYTRFPLNTKTMNILLLGFKESGDVTAVELFYHEMVKRGFKPNNVTYNLRIDAYCKRRCFGDGLRLVQEMESKNCLPTLETITTLIHGAGIARNVDKGWDLFRDLPTRNLCPDIGAYNAMISTLVKCRQVDLAVGLLSEMKEKHIEPDGITYHTLFYGLMKSNGIEGIKGLYQTMVEANFIPKTRTIVMLMKFFCGNRDVDLGLKLWGYLVEKGCCPHDHALALLVTSLCSQGRVQEAYECARQMLSRGRHMSKPVFHMLERFLHEAGEVDKVGKLDDMIRKLSSVYPLSRGHAHGLPTSLA